MSKSSNETLDIQRISLTNPNLALFFQKQNQAIIQKVPFHRHFLLFHLTGGFSGIINWYVPFLFIILNEGSTLLRNKRKRPIADPINIVTICAKESVTIPSIYCHYNKSNLFSYF